MVNTESSLPFYGPSQSKRDKVLIACGPVAIVFMFCFFAAGRLLPPVSPSDSPQALVDHYRQNEMGMKAGIFLTLLSSVLWPFFSIGVNNQLARIPGINANILSLHSAAGATAALVYMIAAMLWASMIYRLDRDAVLTQLLSDLAWLGYTMINTPFVAQQVSTSMGILSDQRSKPLIPRWIAWVILILTLCWVPAYGCHFVYNGPIAWNGAVTFWLVWGTTAIMYTLISFYSWKATGNIIYFNRNE